MHTKNQVSELLVRDPRADAPVVGLDLKRPDENIHRDLRARYPRVIDLWWELETDEKSGWAWSHNRVLCKLVHAEKLA